MEWLRKKRFQTRQQQQQTTTTPAAYFSSTAAEPAAVTVGVGDDGVAGYCFLVSMRLKGEGDRAE